MPSQCIRKCYYTQYDYYTIIIIIINIIMTFVGTNETRGETETSSRCRNNDK
jgi:hypothetical protein